MRSQMQLVMSAYASELQALHDQVTRLEGVRQGPAGAQDNPGNYPGTGPAAATEVEALLARGGARGGSPVRQSAPEAALLAQHRQEVLAHEAHAAALQAQLAAAHAALADQQRVAGTLKVRALV